jgi:alkylation response protein AidB-like acyl-CoA dehydrogenase
VQVTAAWASSRRPAPRSSLRDARITTIYEGTTGIQANDLIGRKIAPQRRWR